MSRLLLALFAATAVLAVSMPAFADDDDRHRHRHGKYKETFWDGPCKVERKWNRKGHYKEERKCKGGYAAHYPPPAYYAAPAPAAGVYLSPPSLVIQPPAIVIQ